MIKQVLSFALCTSIVFGIGVGPKDYNVSRPGHEIRAAAPYMAPALPDPDFDPSKHEASYTSFTYYGAPGESVTLSVEGNSLIATTTGAVSDVDILIIDEKTQGKVKQESGTGSVELDGSTLKENEPYLLSTLITFSDREMLDEMVEISRGDEGVFFIEPAMYQQNKSRMLKLDQFGDPYESFTKGQIDIEIDNDDVQRIAEEITKGCTTDYEKVYAIYSMIVDTFYYDMEQLDYDNDVGYSDDVLTLLRRKISVCEGFSNVFVALCRVCGIPATEVYGFASAPADLWMIGEMKEFETENHAWAVVYLDGKWLTLDPTWDMFNTYDKGTLTPGESRRDWFLIPLESVSYSHIVQNADFSHSIPKQGGCGPSATYSIDENGVCTISGSGELILPAAAHDIFELVFDEDSKITSIGESGLSNCDQLRIIIFPDTLTSIGASGLASCEDLEYVYLPEDLSFIGEGAFMYDDKLAYIYVPDGTRIDKYAFDSCPRLILDIKSKKNISFDGYLLRPVRVIARDE